MNVLPALMLVTLMPSVKILLDLTLVPAKSVLQEMEKHALVRFSYPTELSFLKKKLFSTFRFYFKQHNVR